MSLHARIVGLAGVALAIPSFASDSVAQSAFDTGPVQVVSEWTALDRGDGSGAYTLVTSATSAGVRVEHSLSAVRTVEQRIDETETVRVLEGGEETARAGSDPTALGGWSQVAMTWAIPFDVGFETGPRKSYRVNDKKVREMVAAVVPDAKVATRAGSDGRTMAQVEVPGVRPVDELAAAFTAIRAAFDDAGLGLSKLKMQGTAGPPVTSVATE